MPTQQPEQTFTPHEAAALVGVAVHNVRRWAEYHAGYLSATASPPTGQVKRFTGRDIEVLKHVKDLRALGQTVAVINEQLKSLTFAEIDNSPDNAMTVDTVAQTTLTAPPAAQDGPHAAAPLALSSAALERVEERLDRLERSREPAFAVGMGVGFIAAMLLMIVILIVAVLYGGFR